MGVRFEWTSPDHLIVHTYIEYPWTWEEYQALIDVMMTEIRQEAHPVATIVNITQMRSFPNKGNVMQNLQRIEEVMPNNVFGSVVVGAPHVAIVFMNVLMQIRPKAKRITMFANTIEEARQMLAQRYAELYPDTQPVGKFFAEKS